MNAPLTDAGPVASFSDLGVPEILIEVLRTAGIREPFAIQQSAIAPALDGRDVLGRAPTGSGKTLAFGIPMVARLGEGRPKRPAGLILAPTRELADQIARELEPMCSRLGRSVTTIYGGVGFGAQLKALRGGTDLVVACPGRLEDLISQREIDLSSVSYVVVDEADRMADMGFLPAVIRLLDLTAAERQTVLFSATLDKEVQVLTDNYQDDPVLCEVGEPEPDLSTMTHRFIRTEKEDKIRLAADVIDAAGPTIVFCRTRHGVDRVARQLKRLGVKAGWIHGGRTQRQRDAALDAFTTDRVQALIATDVAARGIHVDGVACVIHYDPPADPKDYVHRSGRTARAGAAGEVVSFVNSDQVRQIQKLQKQVGIGPFPIEPTPELTEREVLAWVDQRGGTKKQKSRSSKPQNKPQSRSQAKPQSKSQSRSQSSGPKANGSGSKATESRPARSKGDQPLDWKPKRSKRPRPSTDGDDEVWTTGGPRRRKASSGSSSGRGSQQRPSGRGGRQGGRPDQGEGSKKSASSKNRTSKRSGKPRPKNRKGGGKTR